jgi:hypothetical protein
LNQPLELANMEQFHDDADRNPWSDTTALDEAVAAKNISGLVYFLSRAFTALVLAIGAVTGTAIGAATANAHAAANANANAHAHAAAVATKEADEVDQAAQAARDQADHDQDQVTQDPAAYDQAQAAQETSSQITKVNAYIQHVCAAIRRISWATKDGANDKLNKDYSLAFIAANGLHCAGQLLRHHNVLCDQTLKQVVAVIWVVGSPASDLHARESPSSWLSVVSALLRMAKQRGWETLGGAGNDVVEIANTQSAVAKACVSLSGCCERVASDPEFQDWVVSTLIRTKSTRYTGALCVHNILRTHALCGAQQTQQLVLAWEKKGVFAILVDIMCETDARTLGIAQKIPWMAHYCTALNTALAACDAPTKASTITTSNTSTTSSTSSTSSTSTASGTPSTPTSDGDVNALCMQWLRTGLASRLIAVLPQFADQKKLCFYTQATVLQTSLEKRISACAATYLTELQDRERDLQNRLREYQGQLREYQGRTQALSESEAAANRRLAEIRRCIVVSPSSASSSPSSASSASSSSSSASSSSGSSAGGFSLAALPEFLHFVGEAEELNAIFHEDSGLQSSQHVIRVVISRDALRQNDVMTHGQAATYGQVMQAYQRIVQAAVDKRFKHSVKWTVRAAEASQVECGGSPEADVTRSAGNRNLRVCGLTNAVDRSCGIRLRRRDLCRAAQGRGAGACAGACAGTGLDLDHDCRHDLDHCNLDHRPDLNYRHDLDRPDLNHRCWPFIRL